jgi:ACS family D-galactonate transporter-like MFS transporter
MAASSANLANEQSAMGRPSGIFRWWIAVLLAIGIVINYFDRFDRFDISVATKPLGEEFHLSNTEIGIILSAHLWSYALLQIPVGALLDRVGVK